MSEPEPKRELTLEELARRDRYELERIEAAAAKRKRKAVRKALLTFRD